MRFSSFSHLASRGFLTPSAFAVPTQVEADAHRPAVATLARRLITGTTRAGWPCRSVAALRRALSEARIGAREHNWIDRRRFTRRMFAGRGIVRWGSIHRNSVHRRSIHRSAVHDGRPVASAVEALCTRFSRQQQHHAQQGKHGEQPFQQSTHLFNPLNEWFSVRFAIL